MTVGSINTASPTTAATSTAAATDNDAGAMQDRFLKLLVAQVNSQDPMNPMDNAQMTSQMAQINTVNGIQQLNKTLTNMASQFTAMQVLQGTSLVGHNVLTNGSTLTPDASTGVAGGAFDLDGKADNVKVDIVGPAGQVLDSVNMGALPPGRQAFAWNAAGYQGGGTVSFKISATLGGKPVAVTPFTQDRVASVGTVNGALSIQLQSGKSVSYTDIAAIQ